MNRNLACNLIATAKRSPDRTALRLDDTKLTYRQLDDVSARVARLLQSFGVRAGDRVALMLPNSLEFAILYYGILRAGAVVVPMNILFKAREISYQLRDCEAAVMFAWSGFSEAAQAGANEAAVDFVRIEEGDLQKITSRLTPMFEPAVRVAFDTAVILYTSGTTGRPKGAELTHANLIHNVEVVRQLFGVTEQSVILGALPLFHSFGQTCGLNAAVFAGGQLTMVQRFEADKVLSVMQRDRVTLFEGVPTMYNALYHHPERESFDLSSLQLCVSGGAAMPGELQRAFEDAFGCIVLEGYGLSETSPVASFNRPDRPRKVGSIGMPVEGVEMKLLGVDGKEVPHGEVGEIAIHGHNVMKGYWHRPEATAEAISPDGWFKSGDLGRVDEEGYYFIVDRKKDMIIRGGFNIYPRELEEVLYGHPAVMEAAVIGIPHPALGEEVGAAVVVRPGFSVGIDELREYMKAEVAAYKYPRHIWLLDALPKTATGKVLKREIEVPNEFLEDAVLLPAR